MEKTTNKDKMDKKGQMSLSDLPNVVILLVVIALVAGVGALIQSEVGDSIQEAQGLDPTNDSQTSTASNVSDDALEGIGELTAQVPLIGLVIGLVVLLVVVLGAFRIFGGRMR